MACPAKNIESSVMVTVSNKTTSANMLPHGEGFADALAAPTAILRGERGGNSLNPTTGAFSLACEHTGKCSPCCITDTFGEVVVLDHPFDIQILNRDVIEIAQDLEALSRALRNSSPSKLAKMRALDGSILSRFR
jgi:hypothetical protein